MSVDFASELSSLPSLSPPLRGRRDSSTVSASPGHVFPLRRREGASTSGPAPSGSRSLGMSRVRIRNREGSQPTPPPLIDIISSGPSRRRVRPLRDLINDETGSASMSRNGSGTGSGRRTPPTIDLTADSDDEIAVTGENIAPRPEPIARPPLNRWQSDPRSGRRERHIEQDEFARQMQNINEAAARHRQDVEALIAADVEDERRRQILSPAPAMNRNPPRRDGTRPIGLGGAVLRSGNRQINYTPTNGHGDPRLAGQGSGADRQTLRRRVEPVRPPYRDDGPDRNVNAERRAAVAAAREAERNYQRDLDEIAGLWDDEDDDDYNPRNDEAVDVIQRQLNLPVPQRQGLGLLDRLGAQAARLRGGPFFSYLDRLAGIGGPAAFPGFGGIGLNGIMGGGPGVAGPAGRGEDEITAIINKVHLPYNPPPRPGFTQNFEFEAGPEKPITVDDNGKVVKDKSKVKPYLSCSNCSEALRLSNAARSEDDKVWFLPCHHLIDQRCLKKLSEPMEGELTHKFPPGGLDVLGSADDDVGSQRGGGNRRSKRQKASKKVKTQQRLEEYEWSCPVDGCKGRYTSVKTDSGWESKKNEEGPLAIYM